MEKDYLKDVTKSFRFVTGNLVSGETGYLSSLPEGWNKFGGFVSKIIVNNGTQDVDYTSYTPDYMVSYGLKCSGMILKIVSTRIMYCF